MSSTLMPIKNLRTFASIIINTTPLLGDSRERPKQPSNMILDLITLAFGLFVLVFASYRLGRQNAYDSLLKSYKGVCQDNEDAWVTIAELKRKLENSCDGKETSND